MRGYASSAVVCGALILALAVSSCGGSSKKAHPAASRTSSTTTATTSKTSARSTHTTSDGGVTSAPGSPNPYGPNSPTSSTGLGRILVRDHLVKPAQAECTAAGLLKELTPPEVQSLDQNRPSKQLKSHVTKAAEACATGAPSGG